MKKKGSELTVTAPIVVVVAGIRAVAAMRRCRSNDDEKDEFASVTAVAAAAACRDKVESRQESQGGRFVSRYHHPRERERVLQERHVREDAASPPSCENPPAPPPTPSFSANEASRAGFPPEPSAADAAPSKPDAVPESPSVRPASDALIRNFVASLQKDGGMAALRWLQQGGTAS